MVTMLDLTPRTVVSDRLATLPVVIIGAGPVGLAAAANLVERGIDFTILEAGSRIADSVQLWGHTRFFSPWKHLIDPASRRLLEASGWALSAAEGRAPSGQELVDDYLSPLADLPEIGSRIRFSQRVIAVTREGMDRTRTAGRAQTPFLLRVQHADGQVAEVTARAVIDASGTYTTPNPLASSGLVPLGFDQVADHVLHALPDVLGADRARFAGTHTVVVGAGHSAANTLIALGKLARDEPGTRVSWVIRNPSAIRVSSSPDDELPDRAKLGTRTEQLVASGVVSVVDSFEISRVEPTGSGIRLVGTRRGEPATVEADLVVNATGFRPDLDMLREVRLELDEIVEAPKRLAPLIDPNLHSCGTVEPHGFRELTHPEQGFFIVGMKSYGRAPTFLLTTGYEQVRSVTAWIDGDVTAASQVALVLPATGVCSTGDSAGASCCS
ncbi:NAD(P)-binding domain-containing protein [Microbacterium azadirachtae]|uniref:NAD(P)-binding domain-containing protein n=1 Tax=Microbacterium azadirachtae TaxID=582680 RepID=UPI0008919CA8|nr:NAD(P)-binding domain-containing protein [Microbacterium azadirachtae]SDL24933.1 Pyridine nucleotide-disulphide oxidoreductase [Microbacterium azadirachtae]SEF54892.1 Pyridine nucleotide-disulphide oxidoreductase [Microbacterium azadirachtae]SEF55180.1 Pyridine nucleotide-disulphide oxidoreductase [Microbacterium azadirachtae]